MDIASDEFPESKNVEFTCPNCGKLNQYDVVFLCNKCKQEEMVFKNNMYICPSCLAPGENFECMLCESKEVKMKIKH